MSQTSTPAPRRSFQPLHLAWILALALMFPVTGCKSDSNGSGSDTTQEDSTGADDDSSTSGETEEDSTPPGGEDGDTEEAEEVSEDDVDTDADEDAADTQEDTGPEIVIPDAVAGEPAAIDPEAVTRTLGEEGPCGTPTLILERGLRRTPYIQSVFNEHARVAWTDTFGSQGSVRYSTAGSGLWRTAEANVRHFTVAETEDSDDYNAYDAWLLGLEEDTDVCYEVYVDGSLLMAGGSFHTAWSSHTKPFTIIAVGDSGTGAPEQYAVRDQMLEADGDFFVHMGDIAYRNGTFSEFEANFFAPYEELLSAMPVWPTPGNHEYNTNFAKPYLDVYYLPEQAWRADEQEYYYSFDYGNVHFVSLDSNEFRYITTIGPRTDSMIHWLRDDLANSDAEWKIVFLHHPPYSSGRHGDMQWVKEHYVPIFEEFGVDLVLAGHDHNYERTHGIWQNQLATETERGITYVVVGSGGASLGSLDEGWYTATANNQVHAYLKFEIDGCIGTGTAIDLEGNTIDGFTVIGCEE